MEFILRLSFDEGRYIPAISVTTTPMRLLGPNPITAVLFPSNPP